MPSDYRPAVELPALTGARWWAAFAVFVLHALVFIPAYPFQKSELFRTIHTFAPMQQGAAGVTFFFVLSGFVIYWSFRKGMPVRLFYRRRILKIYPTHLVAALVFVVAAGVPLGRAVVWAPNVLLVHTWVRKWTTLGGLNVPSWSLCAELLFYFSFPLTYPMVARIPRRGLWWAVAALLVAILALHTGFYLWADGPKGIANTFAPRLLRGDVSPEFEIHASPQWFAQRDIAIPTSYWLSYLFPASRLPEFYLGVIAARLVAEGLWRNTRLTTPLTALVLVYGATWFVPVNYKMSALLVAPMTAVIATSAARDLAGISGLDATRPLVWLGDISYAFYMIQFPVMVIVTRLFIGGHRYSIGGWALWATVVLVISILAAAAIYHGVDRPIMRRFAGRPPGDRPRRAATAADQPPISVRAKP
ncbi:acyltransferase family protein [Nocardia sp. NPDC004260]